VRQTPDYPNFFALFLIFFFDSLLGAGRFDREICLGVPNEPARAKILAAISNNLRLEGNFDFLAIAQKTPGFVGADLQAVAKEAASHAINRIFSNLEMQEKERVGEGK
jgi:ribosome biogenesis ATPase